MGQSAEDLATAPGRAALLAGIVATFGVEEDEATVRGLGMGIGSILLDSTCICVYIHIAVCTHLDRQLHDTDADVYIYVERERERERERDRERERVAEDIALFLQATMRRWLNAHTAKGCGGLPGFSGAVAKHSSCKHRGVWKIYM